jgi:hypothetical protein
VTPIVASTGDWITWMPFLPIVILSSRAYKAGIRIARSSRTLQSHIGRVQFSTLSLPNASAYSVVPSTPLAPTSGPPLIAPQRIISQAVLTPCGSSNYSMPWNDKG